MLASHTKILERYSREGQADKISEWEPKVAKLRQQIEEQEGPSGGYHQPSGYNTSTAPNHGYAQTSTGNYSQPPNQGYPQDHHSPQDNNRTSRGYSNPPVPYGHSTHAGQPRAHEVLSETNMKMTMELAAKDTLIDQKSEEIESLNAQIRSLSEQITNNKIVGADKVAQIEKDIQHTRADIEEARVQKQRELESQRAFMQKEIDQSYKTIEDRDSRVASLSSQLNKIKHDQEDEQFQISSFMTKTMSALHLASQTALEFGGVGEFAVESHTDLGFSQLTVKSVIKNDGSITHNSTL